jgi:hypothetical protein
MVFSFSSRAVRDSFSPSLREECVRVHILSLHSGCSIPVVRTIRVRKDWVRFPAARPSHRGWVENAARSSGIEGREYMRAFERPGTEWIPRSRSKKLGPRLKVSPAQNFGLGTPSRFAGTAHNAPVHLVHKTHAFCVYLVLPARIELTFVPSEGTVLSIER